MKKPKWNNKWQGLSDMRAAKNVARGTIMESTTMVPSGVSVATTTAPHQPKTSSQNRQMTMSQEEMTELIGYLRESSMSRALHYLQSSLNMQQDMDFLSPTFSPTEGTISQEPTPSSSSTEDLTDSCVVLKQGPLEVKGQLTPSILTGDQPTTPSTSFQLSPEDEENLW